MAAKSRAQEKVEAGTPLDPSDEFELRKARYSYVERETDALGRMIGVRRLKLSEQTRITAMTPDLGGMDEVVNPAMPGGTLLVSQRSQYYIVAMVCEINGTHIGFPRNRGEMDAIMDRLDNEGMAAAGDAAMRLLKGDEETDGTVIDQAKNLSATPGSA